MDATPIPSNAPADLFGGRAPIVIGITGHRNLGSRADQIASAVTAQCEKLQNAHPNTPFLLLTGLAEGADRLVANIALSVFEDARLCAVLPLPPEEYGRDFADDASRLAFDTLLAKAVRRVDLYDMADAALWSAPGEGRDEQYARTGAMIAEQAQILIAVWDEKGPRGPGGTAKVVEWFRQGFPPKHLSAFPKDITPLDPSEPGLLIHIHSKTAEVKESEVGAEPLSDRALGAEALASNVREVLKCIDRYNKDVLRHPARIERTDAVLPHLPTDAAQETAATYRTADALAVWYGKWVRAADYLVYGLALVAVFFFNMINDWPIASWAYFGLTGIMALVLAVLWRRNLDARFIEYRGLAEAARILFFLRLAGLKAPIWLRFMSKHAGAVRWVRHAVRALEFCDDHREGVGDVPDGVALVRKNWVEAQIKYHREATVSHWRRYRFWLAVAWFALGVSSAIAVWLSITAYLSMGAGPEGTSLFEWPETVAIGWSFSLKTMTNHLQTILGVLAAAGIAVRAFLARRAHLELAKQFASTRQMFERAGRNLKEADTPGVKPEWTPKEIIESLGQHALMEGAEWVWVRHSRPFEIPS